MKIAIVGPSPVPFTIGGMEYLMSGLQYNINNLSKHQAEIIKVPTKEDNFWNLIDSYKKFYYLDLSHFDMIITCKYPAWMVRHNNHVCYMAHRLRGLYDTYHFMKMPNEPELDNGYIKKAIDYINSNKATIDGLFTILDEIKINQNKIPQKHFQLPSPFLKKIITFLDDKALENAKKFYAISKTVKDRKEYFPKDAKVEVVYPPSALKHFEEGEYDYLFTVSRLDSAKRIDIIIKAMKHVKSDIKLKIAGTGPMEKELKKLAENDKRIEFVGFVNDEELIKYYSNAKGIIFVPYDEDYGLVTIEAMKSKKPVITSYDAGGVTEFVENNVTGFISKFDEIEIGKNIEKLAQLDDNSIRKMGINAYNKVKNIDWLNVVNGLLNENNKKNNKKRIVITSTFFIYPPTGGGQTRTYNICKGLSNDFEIDIVSIIGSHEKESHKSIYNSLTEHCIPKTEKHQNEEYKIEQKANIPVTDIAMPKLIKYTPKYSDNLKELMKKADLIIASHPYMYEEIMKNFNEDKQILIYDAQDVEYLIKQEMLKNSNNKTTNELLENVKELERKCCEKAKLIITCSKEDKISISELYSIQQDKIVVVPNGVDTSITKFVDVNNRIKNKMKYGLKNEKIGLFMGSWHKPNLEACEEIFKIAQKCPDTKFMLMGSQCAYFENKEMPENVGLLGLVSEGQKNQIFSMVDFALNPMKSGSGTNLKMFDYMAAGIPIITTEFGTRGIENKEVFIIKEIETMYEAINNFNIKENVELVKKSRRYVENTFDWKIISEKLKKSL